jgi:hypothetical protein
MQYSFCSLCGLTEKKEFHGEEQRKKWFFVGLKKNDSLFAKPGSSIVFHFVIHVIHGIATLIQANLFFTLSVAFFPLYPLSLFLFSISFSLFRSFSNIKRYVFHVISYTESDEKCLRGLLLFEKECNIIFLHQFMNHLNSYQLLRVAHIITVFFETKSFKISEGHTADVLF